MTQQPFEHVSFDKPDEVRQGDNWRLDIVNLAGGAQVGRLTIQPSTSDRLPALNSAWRRISNIT